MDELQILRLQVAERDTIITTLKDKTKAYVQALREEHASEVSSLQKKLFDSQKQGERKQETELTAKPTKIESSGADKISSESNLALTQANRDLALKVSKMELEVQSLLAENRDNQLRIHEMTTELSELKNALNTKDTTISKQTSLLSVSLTAEDVQRRLQDLTSKHERVLITEKQTLQDQHQRAVISLREEYQEQVKIAALRESSLKRQVLELESKLSALTVNSEQSNSKIKAYIESLVADNDKLLAACSSTAEERTLLISQSAVAKREFDVKNELNEKTLLENGVALDQLRRELYACQLSLQDRDNQILEHNKSIRLISTELDDHKSKRLQARNEMIGCAQQLEKTLLDVKEIKALLKRDICAIVSEHITGLESVLTLLEIVNTQLSSSSSVATTSFSPLSSKKRNEKKETATNQSQTVSASTDDVFQQIYFLRDQLVQANTGTMLLSHAVRRLQETASKTNEESCCSALFLSIRQKFGRYNAKDNRRDSPKNLQRGKYDRVIMDTSAGADSPRSSGAQSTHSKEVVDYAVDSI